MDECWEEREDSLKKQSMAHLGGESFNYAGIKCSRCAFSSLCPSFSTADGGCAMRKSIYEGYFNKIEFKNEDPLATNRLRLLARYFTELLLFRNFGIPMTATETSTLKTVLNEFSKLAIDKKGELVSNGTKNLTPWELDSEAKKLQEELVRNRKEIMMLKTKKEKLSQEEEKDGKS